MQSCENNSALRVFSFFNMASTGVGSLVGAGTGVLLKGATGASVLQAVGAGAIAGGLVSVPLSALFYYCSRGWNPCPNEHNTEYDNEYDTRGERG